MFVSIRRTAGVGCRKQGFTLIELLVVISIIALLVGILLPALAAARNAATSAVSLANQRSNGQAIAMYVGNNKGYFPTAYQYRGSNAWNNMAIGSSSSSGYLQWSGILALEGYIGVTSKSYIDPRHSVGGWAPTNFVTTLAEFSGATTADVPDGIIVEGPPPGQTTQTAGVIDTQAPRLSYVPNEMIMPRMKNAALKTGGYMRLARIDEMDKQDGTILLAEYSDFVFAVGGTSISGGGAIKTHRPTNGVKVGANGVFNGEDTTAGYTGNDIRALEVDDVINNSTTGFDSVNPSKGGTSNGDDHAHHIVYATEGRHNGSGNYSFVDGHGANHRLADTLKQEDFMWGTHAWSQVNKQPILKSDGTGVVR